MEIAILIKIKSSASGNLIINDIKNYFEKCTFKSFRISSEDYDSSINRLEDCFDYHFGENLSSENLYFISVIGCLSKDVGLLDEFDLYKIFKESLFKFKFCLSVTIETEKIRLFKELVSFSKKAEGDMQVLKMPGQPQWDSIEQLILFVNKACEWVILRNYESLLDNEHQFKEDDIDALGHKLEILRSAMNAKPRQGGRCSYETNIANQRVLLDLRCVGDKYYDPLWANEMLNTRQYYGILPVLREDHYFFSLLYHALLQKPYIKKGYFIRLPKMGQRIGVDITNIQGGFDNRKALSILNSFLRNKNFKYTHTGDCFLNYENINQIEYQEIYDRKPQPLIYLKWFVIELTRKFKKLIRI